MGSCQARSVYLTTHLLGRLSPLSGLSVLCTFFHQKHDRAMIRQICNVKPQDIVTTRSNELLSRLGTEDLDLILKERRLCWYGHVERSNGAVKTAFDLQVDGKLGPGRPKMTWKQLTERDWREWKLSAIDPHNRHTWRSGLRSAIHAASQLLEGGPLMWMLSLYLHVNQNPLMMMMMMRLYKRYVAELGFECATSGFTVKQNTDCPMEPGTLTF